MSAGKGDKFRPVKKKTFDSNFDVVNWVTRQGIEIRPYIVNKGKKIYKKNDLKSFKCQFESDLGEVLALI